MRIYSIQAIEAMVEAPCQGSAPVCREPWTLVDAIYFCTVTMSTVGYGDMSPHQKFQRSSHLSTFLLAFRLSLLRSQMQAVES